MKDTIETHFEMLPVQLEAIHPLNCLLCGFWGVITHKTEALALSRLLVDIHLCRDDVPTRSEEGFQVGVGHRRREMIDKQVRSQRTLLVETRVIRVWNAGGR